MNYLADTDIPLDLRTKCADAALAYASALIALDVTRRCEPTLANLFARNRELNEARDALFDLCSDAATHTAL